MAGERTEQMKLYAKVTSERASKGQGGNEYISILLKNDKQEVLYGLNYTPQALELWKGRKLVYASSNRPESKKGIELGDEIPCLKRQMRKWPNGKGG